MATQEEVQQLVDELGTIKGDLDAAKANIENEFSQLETELAGAGASVDLTPLKSAIDGLTPQAEALEQLKANPPAPAPAPANEAPGATTTSGTAATAEPPSREAIDQAAAQGS